MTCLTSAKQQWVRGLFLDEEPQLLLDSFINKVRGSRNRQGLPSFLLGSSACPPPLESQPAHEPPFLTGALWTSSSNIERGDV